MELPVPIQPKQPTTKGPAEWFTGDVFIDAIARGEEPSRVRVNAVRFTPSVCTAWHSHAMGQTLCVTERPGLVQTRGGLVEDIRAGDLVSTPPRRVALARRRPRPLHDASFHHRSPR
jgi:quercetin dioxygenase-like cupin family protein